MVLDQFNALLPENLPDTVHVWGFCLGMCRHAADPGPGRGSFVELCKDHTTDTVARAFASELLLESDLSLWMPTEPVGT